jgi:hypothetical protein
VVLALALGACRSPEAGPEQEGALPEPGALTCEALIPLEVREALPGFLLEEQRPCPTCGPLCSFRSPSPPDTTVSLAYDCRARRARTEVGALLEPTLRAGGVEVPALGRAAARRELVPGMVQVVAWDDDTPCLLVVTWLGADTARAVDIARLALSATTRERLARSTALPPPDAGPP